MAHPLRSHPCHRLLFSAENQVAIEAFEVAAPGDGEVLVETVLSLMSTGTENTVLTRAFDAGTHWHNWVKYPFYPGYSAVGVVAAVGSGISDLAVGTRVACRMGHRSHSILPASACYPIPPDTTFDEAVWFSLAKIGFRGAAAARYTLGDQVLVIGSGPIGQMSIRWARAAGAATIVTVDPIRERLPFSLAGGATVGLCSPVSEAREAIVQANSGRLPRVVVDSTGNAAVFATALTLAADRGTVILLGDTGQPDQQHLTGDVMVRGLTIVGAHDTQGAADWNDSSITRLFFQLVSTGRFPLGGLNTHYFSPSHCREAYSIANQDRAKTMGIVFDWRGETKSAD